MDYEKLSKTMALALRHEPAKFGLKLNNEGWTSLDKLLAALQQRAAFAEVTRADIETMLAQSDKQRYEILDNKIRAFYGHSVRVIAEKETTMPPPVLYHGTTPAALESILLDGLLPMTRQYVHLSTDLDSADAASLRRSKKALILRVRAKEAHDAGTKFYVGKDNVWLADSVPPRFIDVEFKE